MIDTIKAYIPINELNQTVKTTLISKQTNNNKLNDLSKNNTKNFTTSIKGDKIFIEGSLCKFYFGNNVQTLNFDSVILAIKQLKEVIGLPIETFKISRIDFSENLKVNKEPCNYVSAFDNIDKWQSNNYNIGEDATGKYFNRSQKSFLVYDKTREVNKHKAKYFSNGQLIQNQNNNHASTSSLQYNNLLRLEFRLVKNIAKQLGLDRLTISDLTNRAVYNKLIREWLKTICQIQYREVIIPDISCLAGIPEIERALYFGGVQFFGGYSKLLADIRRFKPDTPSQKTKKARIVHKIKTLQNNYLLDSFGRDLFLEVRRKAVKIALQQLGKR